MIMKEKNKKNNNDLFYKIDTLYLLQINYILYTYFN